MAKVLVVGGGITSAATAAFMKEKLREINLTIFDKARGAGGRMSTSRSPNNSECTADLGAQYISVSPEYGLKQKEIYEDLLQNGVMKPLASKIEGLKSSEVTDYVVPNGMSSLVKHFFKKSGVSPIFQKNVNKIKIVDNDKIAVSTSDGSGSLVQAAILTMPVPQILILPGMDSILKPEIKQKLEKVEYSSRYALALFFDKFESDVILANNGNSGAHYIKDDPIFCYAAINTVRRGCEGQLEKVPTSVVFHTKVPWGIQHLEDPIPEVEKVLIEHYKSRYPNWPNPTSTKCLRWRYSQVFKPYEKCPKAIILNENPLLIAGGDGFMPKSGFDTCLDSASAITDILNDQL